MRSTITPPIRSLAPWLIAMGMTITGSAAALADVESGPAVDGKIPALRVFAVTGESREKELDVVAERGERPTLFILVPTDRWTRPSARLLRELDKAVTEIGGEARAIAVWLTDDQAAAKNYLPLAQQSLQFQRTDLTVYVGDKAGPPDWMISSRADLTVVVANKGKVLARFGLVSPNETSAADIVKALKAAVQ